MDRPRKDAPLEGEARARGEWREDATTVDEAEAPGHTRPASEDDDERMRAGGDGDPVAHPGTLPPPD